MISVVIPSYHQFARLIRCVDSVQRSSGLAQEVEVIVVTSGYGSDQVDSLRARGCKLIQLESPVPTSRSRNIGGEFSTGDLLLFLDDDNVVAPDAIALLAEALLRWPDAVVVGPAMYYGEAPEKLWCAGVRRSRVLMKTFFRGRLPDPLPERLPSEDFPNCFMVRRSQFAAVGGFDELHFPQQWEEGDLARRLTKVAGGSVYLVPMARVWHFIELPLARRLHLRNADRAFLVARGRAMFTALHGDALQWAAYLVAAQWMFGAFYLGAALTLPSKDRMRVMAGYVRGMRGGLVDGWRARAEARSLVRTAHQRT